MYSSFQLIDEELKIIQDSAFSFEHSKIRNDKDIRKIIDINDRRYVEDFLKDIFLAELNKSNNLDSSNTIYTVISDNYETERDIYDSDSSSYKDMVQESIVDDFNDYKTFFKIKGVDIPPKKWDFLFDTMFSFYVEKDISDLFFYDMGRLNRFAFSLALLKNTLVSIECYTEGLGYLESTYLSDEDIIEIRGRLANGFDSKKLIDFNEGKLKNKMKVKRACNLNGNKIIDFNSHRSS